MKYSKGLTVLTLDAGGTNLVFRAVRDFKFISSPISLQTNTQNLESCVNDIIKGFSLLKAKVGNIDVISFAFPGPADYQHGILGNLPNFEFSFEDYPLGPTLSRVFSVPVFINNDGNLFALGESISGFLPHINNLLKEANSHKRYQNLIGITLGTGIGCGIIINNNLLIGDNFCSGEIHNMRNPIFKDSNIEESVSKDAITRTFIAENSKQIDREISPKYVYEIAIGSSEGDQNAALHSFEIFGKALGSVVADTITLIDAMVVISGGLSEAWKLFSPYMFNEINRVFKNSRGRTTSLSVQVLNMQDPLDLKLFMSQQKRSKKSVDKDHKMNTAQEKYVGVGLSTMKVSDAVAIGANAWALQQLNQMK